MSMTLYDFLQKLNFTCRLAGEYGLRLKYVKEFHEVFSENSEHPDFKPLLQHMKVVDANGESQMDEDQWEAASTSLHASSMLHVLNCPRHIPCFCFHEEIGYEMDCNGDLNRIYP